MRFVRLRVPSTFSTMELRPGPSLALPPPTALTAPHPPAGPSPLAPLESFEPWAWGVAAVALGLAGYFATLRQALDRSSRSRVLGRAHSDQVRARMLPLLRRADALATSASAFRIACELTFTVAVLGLAVERGSFGLSSVLLALAISVPSLVFFAEVVPGVFVRSHGDRLLLATLPSFYVIQLPFAALTWVLEWAGRLVRRVLGMPDSDTGTRELVEDIRDVIEESDREGDLAESEREIIENIMEFHEVDAAEIMTPRTEIVAVDVNSNLEAAMEAVATSGHSRIPVFENNLDSIIGAVAARDLLFHLSRSSDAPILRELMRPTPFVPETKLVSQLLGEFRRGKQKMAVVLDEYGGTAGLVTMSDILSEIVGEIPDEFDEETPAPIVKVAEGVADVDASLRLSEVNENLDLELPEEEDYETLAGYVLAELGRFPKLGETFEDEGTEFTVLECNDRRVLKVRVRRSVGSGRS